MDKAEMDAAIAEANSICNAVFQATALQGREVLSDAKLNELWEVEDFAAKECARKIRRYREAYRNYQVHVQPPR